MSEMQEILFDARTIENKVSELAATISRDYEGKDLVLVCILKGAVTFTADLMRRLTIPVEIDFVRAASYGASTVSARKITITKDIETDIRGKHVLLVDGIIDSGDTLACLFKRFAEKGPASVKAIVLLDKKSRRMVGVPLAYRGFEIPDTFVVGYGMDCAEKYRQLPYIAALKPSSR
ncbi:MAG: hypoxanthine phosphoribosyltransferase [Nitrospirae bacterium RBG_19FT_COMBO_55_12]|nr:MAG: hypoxanthine phosphoribosyltransferase [Nitrospirae bacterium RBG_19FT_COMBO_55_12]